ncbi:sodium-coupled monocarboxylate transporter 1-like [Chrysoperla carnea]|uniref:sodium-coupled monocarboxylate transporter 1-like n=1 Tax=Chrysoperla carnea TaxID=189513 RepID=UPI001D06597C|nr:sodium-coupled monocarboxylate transporter 1-like [Chrysoperla carnea]
MNVSEILLETRAATNFTWIDFTIFILLLCVCLLVGIYFGFFNVSENAQDYLVGGRSMSVIPISLSLVASFISGISLLGIPTEIYLYGIQYVYIAFGIISMGVVMSIVYVPVLHQLQLTSSYEYLQLRFDKRMRLLAATLFTFTTINWLPIVIFVPALAFNQVTGINVHIITPIVCLVCIFYTCVGGIRAVVWTDVIQSFVMYGSILLVVIKGTIDVGGINVVLKRNYDSGRIELPVTDPSLLTRHTIWGLAIGGFAYWLQANGTSQLMLQRYLSLPNLRKVRWAVFNFVLGILCLLCSCGYGGMLIYAKYYDCDPLSTKLVKAKDQLMLLLVMDTLGDIPGLPGIFLAGVFSAALSSLSTGLNSMSAIVLEDFYKLYFGKPSPLKAEVIMKTVVVVVGVSCVGLAFLVEKMGTVLQLAISLEAITNGPNLGIFTMGILLPWIRAKAAFIGGVSGLLIMAWIGLNAQAAIVTGAISFEGKPLTTDGCQYSFTQSEDVFNITHIADKSEEIFFLYRISYLWYTLIGCIISILIAFIVSYLTSDWNDPQDMDPLLLSPVIRKYFTFKKTDVAKKDIKDKYASEDDHSLDDLSNNIHTID